MYTNILIFGYFDQGNYGDELFKNAFGKIFAKSNLYFENLDFVKEIPNNLDLIIFGGGDLINDYFLTKFQKFFQKFDTGTIPIIAFGVGFSSRDVVINKNLKMFDFIYSRTFDSLVQLKCAQIVPFSQLCFGPDIVCCLPFVSSPTKFELKRVALIPSADRISNTQKICEHFLNLNMLTQVLIFDSKKDVCLKGLNVVSLPCENLFEQYDLIYTFKFHGLVLALMQAKFVLVHYKSFKSIDLMNRVFGEKDAENLIIYDYENRFELEKKIDYIQKNRKNLQKKICDYQSFCKIFFDTIKFDDEVFLFHDKRQFFLNTKQMSKNSKFFWGLQKNYSHDLEWLTSENIKTQLFMKPFNIKIDHSFDSNIHRFGWNFVIDNIESLDNKQKLGIQIDTFLDATNEDCVPILVPWIGFVHHPIFLPHTYSPNCFFNLYKSNFFKISKSTCQGLIVFSNYLKQKLEELDLDLQVFTLYHPMPQPAQKWKLENWLTSKTIFSLGGWLRNVFSIYLLDLPNKWVIRNKHSLPPKTFFVYETTNFFDNEKNKWLYFCNLYLKKYNRQVSSCEMDLEKDVNWHNYLQERIDSINVSDFLNNEEYDKMMTSAIIFLDLFDCSACNAVLECIMYNTPLIINKHPAIVEYLGEDYPLYFEDFDLNKIEEAHEYLQRMDKRKFSSDYFREELRKIGQEISLT